MSDIPWHGPVGKFIVLKFQISISHCLVQTRNLVSCLVPKTNFSIYTGAVRVGYINDEVVINPTRTQQRDSKVNLVLAAVRGQKICEFLRL